MDFSRRTLGATSQLLDTLPPGNVSVLLKKAGIEEPGVSRQDTILWELESASKAAMHKLLTELLTQQRSIRFDSYPKYVFDDRMKELERSLRLDGWDLTEGRLHREHPSSPELIELSDALHNELTQSAIDDDRGIRTCLEKSATAFTNHPPDYNSSSINVRVALETTARRLAQFVAKTAGLPAPADTWGHAIAFLREHGQISGKDEGALTASYTATSDGAHVPKGLSDREWARMIRALDQAWMYYLIKREGI